MNSLIDRQAAARLWWDEVRLPLGDRKVDVLLVSDGSQLVAAYFGPLHPGASGIPSGWRHDPKPLAEATAQLQSYTAGELSQFDLPLQPRGTPFQQEVWAALVRIP